MTDKEMNQLVIRMEKIIRAVLPDVVKHEVAEQVGQQLAQFLDSEMRHVTRRHIQESVEGQLQVDVTVRQKRTR